MINTVLFDLDGTICDTNQLIIQSLRYVLSSENPNDLSDAYLLKYWGKPLYYQLNNFLPGRDDYDSLAQRYRIFYNDNQAVYLREFPGIWQMLDELSSANKTIGIVTSKLTRFAVETLNCLNYQKYFQCVIGCDQVVNVKPNPEPILKAIEICGSNKQETIYIGDNVDDIIAANNCNIFSAVVGWSLTNRQTLLNESPDFTFLSPSDISKEIL